MMITHINHFTVLLKAVCESIDVRSSMVQSLRTLTIRVIFIIVIHGT